MRPSQSSQLETSTETAATVAGSSCEVPAQAGLPQAVSTAQVCPICCASIVGDNASFNAHLDECLNTSSGCLTQGADEGAGSGGGARGGSQCAGFGARWRV